MVVYVLFFYLCSSLIGDGVKKGNFAVSGTGSSKENKRRK
jgi:hypothetical protein